MRVNTLKPSFSQDLAVVLAEADPLVRAQVAPSDRAWDAFETWNHLFGFFLGIVNLFFALWYYAWLREAEKAWSDGWRFASRLVNIVIVLPVAVAFVAAPFFADFVLESPVTRVRLIHVMTFDDALMSLHRSYGSIDAMATR